ncbi:hypothetical protein [Bradyrhizobium jicamae]|uniref:hypothetical protein n=1 Tax=Bradyrhizobium jicamae TaxID=280332 RepID=UPI0012ED09F5|nr:hypothetical protein [Bradyrhizobium jicamae]
MTVFVYVNTSKPARDVDYIKVFANQAAARAALTPTSPRGERGEGEQPASVDHLDDLLLLGVN